MKEIIPCLLIFLIGTIVTLGIMLMYSTIFSYWLTFEKYVILPMVMGNITVVMYLIKLIMKK